MRFTVKSNEGRYCFCKSCGAVWHVALTPDGEIVKNADAIRRFPQLTPLPLNCPRCPRQMVYVTTLHRNVRVYTCDVHGEWHLGPGGLYAPDHPPPAARAMLGESKPH